MKQIIIIALFSFLFSSCDLLDPRPKDTKIAHRILRKTAKEIKEKLDLKSYSITESGPSGKYELLGLGFIKNGKISKSEGRVLMIKCIHIFLKNINTEEKFQEYLSPNPFTEKNINLSILIYDKGDERFYRPDITSLNLINGSIYYRYNIKGEEYKLEHDKETYEEALEIIKMENEQ